MPTLGGGADYEVFPRPFGPRGTNSRRLICSFVLVDNTSIPGRLLGVFMNTQSLIICHLS
jgi:hypothetical protein